MVLGGVIQFLVYQFPRIPLLRGWVNRVASDALRAYDKPLIQHLVLYDTVCFRTLTFQTILDTLDTYRKQRSLVVA